MAAGTFIQQQKGSATSGNTINVTLDRAPVAGNTLILFYGSNPVSTTLGTAVQTGVTWARIDGSNSARNNEIWLGTVGTSPSASLAITTNGTLSGSGGAAILIELAGPLVVSPTDQHSPSTAGVSSNPTTSSITTTTQYQILVASYRSGATSPTLNSGPTNLFTGLTTPLSPTGGFNAAYRVVNAVGTYSCDWTISVSGSYDACIASLKIQSGVRLPNRLRPAPFRP